MTGIALVTGANRGIGLEVVRQIAKLGFTTVLGSRDLAKGQQAAAPLLAQGLPIEVQPLDVTDSASVNALRQTVENKFGHLDVLINNAAILYDSWQHATDADFKVVQQALETNTYGAWRMCQVFLPLLRQSQHGRIVNVSSEAGSLASMGGGTPAYNVSKVVLNALTRMLAAELRGAHILVNSVCPG